MLRPPRAAWHLPRDKLTCDVPFKSCTGRCCRALLRGCSAILLQHPSKDPGKRSPTECGATGLLRAARLQNEIAPETFLNWYETLFEKSDTGSENRSETWPKISKPLSRRLEFLTGTFLKVFDRPTVSQKSKKNLPARLCRGRHAKDYCSGWATLVGVSTVWASKEGF